MASYVFAADLGGTKCSAAVIGPNGRIVSRRTVSVDRSSSSGAVLQIQGLAEELAEDGSPAKSFAAAAVAVPGLVRRDTTVWAPNLPGWQRMPLASRLCRLLGIPVAVESDRIAALLGECWKGAGRGRSDVIVVVIGTGIGAGILSGGRVLRGAHELSGCIGWLTVTREEVPNASQRGELESLAAGPGITRAVWQRLRNGEKSSRLSRLKAEEITALDVADAARRGDRLARNVFRNSGRHLGFAVANLVSLFDPEVVVITGGMAASADLYLDSLKAAMFERAQPLAVKEVRLVVSRLGNEANLLGCAHLAWKLAGAVT